MLPKPNEPELRGLTLEQMRRFVRKGLGGLDSNDLTDTEVDELLNLAFWDLEARFPFKEKECRVEFPLTIGENQYLLPGNTSPNLVDLEAIQSISVVDDNGTIHKVERMTQQHWDAVIGPDREDSDLTVKNPDYYGLPIRYVRMDETIILHPTPDKAYRLRIYFLKTLKALVEGSIEQLNLPREWNIIVVRGAIVHGQFFHEDYNLAQQAEDFMLRQIHSAVPVEHKEEVDSRYSRLIVQWEEPGGGNYE